MVVTISDQFPLETQRFTAAHELGHAILHRQQSLHRDRPVNGAVSSDPRSGEEREADRFASFYLMPAKRVRHLFQVLFSTDKLLINEDTAFNLNTSSVEVLKAKSLRSLARTLASAESYGGRNFISLAKRFGVSVEAMAIRLEELELFEL